jgi:LuxR family transcriptional regulator, quorum-sensing system regulator CviR
LELAKWISKNDAVTILEITNSSLFCDTEEKYREIIKKFNGLLFFDHFIIGLMNIRHMTFNDMVAACLNVGYPAGYFKTYLNSQYPLIDPLCQRFFKTSEIQNSVELKDLYDAIPGHPVLKLREEFGINNIFFNGIYDSDLHFFTILSLAGWGIKNDQRTKCIITYLSPFLSVAIRRLIPFPKKADIPSLTPSELEVLKWLKQGKSSWDISTIMNRSERVINFHINNILKKLNATNRTHAVAIALDNNLIVL